MKTSMIGIRCYWKCAECDSTVTSLQMEFAGVEQKLTVPPNWRVIAKAAYCGDHQEEAEKHALAEAVAA